MRILSAIERSPGGISLSTIARATKIAPSRVHHYLVSLARTGMATQDSETSLYGLGPYTLQLGLSALERIDASRTSAEYLRAVRDRTSESVFLAVWGNHGPTVVRWEEGSRSVTVQVRIGMVMPLIQSATGHVFLAWMPDLAVRPVLERELRADGQTMSSAMATRVARLRRETIARGLGKVEGSLLPTISALAAPVFSHDGRLAGSLTALGWTDGFDPHPRGTIGRPLAAAAAGLSHDLGYRGPPNS